MRAKLIPVLTIALAAACTAGNESDKTDEGPKAKEPQTITMWHGWSAPHEVKAFTDTLKGFQQKFPHITVKIVKGQDDDKIIHSIRGNKPPDVAASFTTDNVAEFCKSGLFQELSPWLKQSGIDINILPKVVQDYTQYKGKRCVMPLLADAYGLYYNKKLMKGEQPPKSLSELTRLAKKLTVRDGDGNIKVAGFMPSVQYYEHTPAHLGPTVGGKWYNPDGTSAIGSDPAWRELLTWQKQLIDWYGHDKLEKFRKSLGQEFSPENPFQKGRVAMAIDGEWRTAFLAKEAPSIEYGTAPMPVADSRASSYGSGFVSGTIVGVPRGAKHQQAAWELVRYLTTDTTALVTLANSLRNVPSTKAALQSPALKKDANFQTFLDVFNHPASSTVPAQITNAFNQDMFEDFIVKWESGREKNLEAGLRGVDKRINDKLKLVGG